MKGGYVGKFLRVDLTNKRVAVKELEESLLLNYIGGRGIGVKIIYDEIKPGTHPLSPDNKLVVSTGPLTGTPAQSCSRIFITSKSVPGGIHTTSSGGPFGPQLKAAGFDYIIIEGKADKPTFLWINDGRCELKDASHVWGIFTKEASEILKAETDSKAEVMCIGPAGEKMVHFASVMTNDGFSACGRGGMGAIMGSKNLKAIVVRGTGEVNVANDEEMREAVREQIELYKKHPSFEGFHNLGTSLVTLAFYEIGHNPTFNFRQEEIRNVEIFAPENIGKYIVKHYGCPNCICGCKKIMKITSGPYSGVMWDMPEYETQWAFGNNIGNTNFESIIVLGMLCDEYGMDTISTGNVIGFAIELCELGILSKSEVGIPNLSWGNYEAVLELLRKIALREGIGNVLADGVMMAAQKIGRGAEKYAMQIKGLELAAYDPRAAKAHGLSWSTLSAPRHSVGWSKHEIIGLPEKIDPYSTEGKGRIAKYNQDESAFCEALGFCIMVPAFYFITDQQYAKLAYAATGIKQFKDPKYLWLVGERIINLERAFGVREGWDRKQDTMPQRIVKEPIPRKAAHGQVFELEKLLDDYYEVRGWDKKTGIPTEEKLRELGLDDVAKELRKYRQSLGS